MIEKSAEKLLVFIPCYNCGPQIPRVLRQFETQKTVGFFSEILVLDNNSTDNTVAAAIDAVENKRLRVPVTIGRNRANYNLGGSHKAAFRYAVQNGFSHVVVLHGDDQGNILDLLPVLASGRHLVMDACLGARFMRESELVGYSRFRIFGNHVFNQLFSAGTGTGIKDLGSGLNVFGTAVIEDQRVIRYADDLRFNIYMLLGLHAKKQRFEYFPISWREDDQVSNVKMTSQALKTLALLWLSVADKNGFWTTDHRTVRHASYEFDVVHKQ